MPKKSTTIVRVCLLVLAGGFAAQHSRVPVNASDCVVLFAAVVLLLTYRRVHWFAFLLLGFTLFVQAANRVTDARLEARFAGDSMITRVRIADFPKSSGESTTLLIEPLNDSRLPPRSRVSWFQAPEDVEMGDIWTFELRLRRPYGSSNPGLFSLEDWMFRQGLHASGYVVDGKRNRRENSGSLSTVEQIRQNVVARIVAEGGEAAPVLAAIGVGSRHLIDRDQWDRYAITGTSHLMAISGLHIGLAAASTIALVALLCGFLRVPGNYLRHGTTAGVLVATLYAIISGFAVPSQRATVMLGFAAAAFFLGRRVVGARIVAMVALAIFIVNPLAIMAPGFALSFAAVIVLLWFTHTARIRPHHGGWRGRVFDAASRLTSMQLALFFGLLPLTAMIFQRVTFAAPLANLLVVPVFSFVTVPLTLLSLVLQPFLTSISAGLLYLAAISVEICEWVIRHLSALPGASVELAGIGGGDNAYLCFILLPTFWLLLPRGWPGRRIAFLGVCAVLLHGPRDPPRSCIDTHVLDVGQGLSVVVKSRNRTLVFDTGASYRGGGSAAEQIVLPFLRHRGIRRIDWLVVSHSDDDHAGGTATLLRDIRVGQVLSGEPLPGVDRRNTRCVAGQSWAADGIRYRFLHPQQGSAWSGNNASCVLSISLGDRRLVLTGDIEAMAEQALLRWNGDDRADVVLIPHHGSLTSSTPGLVNRLQPELAIASAAKDNRWGFPKERVVRRWQGAGAVVLDTARSGAISFRLCPGDGLTQLQEDRVRRLRFWHDSTDL